MFRQDDLYPRRIPVEFGSVEKGNSDKRPQQKIREFLKHEHGSRHGTVILFGMKIHEEDEEGLDQSFAPLLRMSSNHSYDCGYSSMLSTNSCPLDAAESIE